MSLYSKARDLRLRKESWGGIAGLSSGRIVLVPGKELFALLESFVPTVLEDGSLPDQIARLLRLGLVSSELNCRD